MRDDSTVIEAFCQKVGGLKAAAALLQTEERPLTPQHIYNWRKRGRVAPEQRFHFREVFNREMPKRKHLGLEWLAAPAINGNRSASHGRKSRQKAPARKGRSR